MPIELKAGLASLYFIQDQARGLAQVENPHVIISGPGRFTEEAFAELLVSQREATFFARLLGRSFERPEEEIHRDRAALLDTFADLRADRKFTFPFGARFFSEQMLILAEDFEAPALSLLKILKVRGIFESLVAVKHPYAAAVQALKQLLGEKPAFRTGEGDLALYPRKRKLRGVFGVRNGVLSETLTCRQILQQYPGIVAAIDLAMRNEPI